MSHIHPSKTRFHFYKLPTTQTLTIPHTIDRHFKVLSVCSEPIRLHRSNSPAAELLIHHTYTHTSAAIMINVDLQTKDRSKYLHTNTMFHKCSTHEVRDTDLIFLVLTHTLCSCEPNQSPWQPQSMFPLGGVMVGVQDTEAIQNERKRQIEREQCAYLKRWARSQNNSSINRAGGMMPHLHTHLHTHNQAPHTDQVENLLSYAFPHTI